MADILCMDRRTFSCQRRTDPDGWVIRFGSDHVGNSSQRFVVIHACRHTLCFLYLVAAL